MFFVNTLHLSVSKLKKKTFKLNEQQMSFFNDCLKNICEETNFLKLDSFMQHGDTTCLWHSIARGWTSDISVESPSLDEMPVSVFDPHQSLHAKP